MPTPPIQLPRDYNSQVVQTLSPIDTITLSAGAVSVRDALPSDTTVVRVASLVDVYIKFGDSTVTATSGDVLFPAGAEVFKVPVDPTVSTHIATLQVSAGGNISVTKMV